MRIEQVQLTDRKTLQVCHDVYRAAHRVDDPLGRETPSVPFKVWMMIGWGGQPREVWVARGDDGVIAGCYRLQLPDGQNRHHAQLTLTVHPLVRRRGIGRALLAHATQRAAGQDRTLLLGCAWRGTAGDAFARAAGATEALPEIRRVQVLADIAPETLASLRARARQAAAGYAVVTWREPVPEEYVDGMVAVLNAYQDMPHSETAERVRWDAGKLRNEARQFPHFGHRGYTAGAVHAATGALVAASTVLITPDDPDWGYQGITSVVAEHRGHRLGLLTKLALLDWLATAEPRLERIETLNHEVNSYMIAINEALGYQIVGPPNIEWELDITPA